jgi:dATP pyrophosphohydrolase
LKRVDQYVGDGRRQASHANAFLMRVRLTDMAETSHKIPLSVLVVIHSPQGEVLMIERAKQPGFWQSVTGSKDREDEPWAETAAREVLEETGIVVGSPHVPIEALQDWFIENVYEIYPIWRHRYAPGVTHNTERVFGLSVPRDLPITLAPREHTQHVWLPWREAADLCFSPSNAEAILQLPVRARLLPG